MKNGSKQQRHIATAVEGAAWISYFEAQRYTGLGAPRYENSFPPVKWRPPRSVALYGLAGKASKDI
jgi:hypothetical protein